jgi:hypothetical protein
MDFDSYSIQARLKPTLLVVLPAGFLVTSFFPPKLLLEGSIVGIASTLGVTYLLAELGRDVGRKKQPKLWKCWGGTPSTRMLRHRDKTLSPLTRERYHTKLEKFLGRKMPTIEEEKQNPSEADLVYKTCGDYLLEKTRDAKRFPLILKENISYGFRRNLWGMKPAGIFISLIGLFGCGAIAANRWTESEEFAPIPILGTIVSAMAMALWIFRIKPDWIRLPAEAYAQRLLASCDEN